MNEVVRKELTLTAFMSPPMVCPSLMEHCSVASPRSDARGIIATKEMMKSGVDPVDKGVAMSSRSSSSQAPPATPHS